MEAIPTISIQLNSKCGQIQQGKRYYWYWFEVGTTNDKELEQQLPGFHIPHDYNKHWCRDCKGKNSIHDGALRRTPVKAVDS